MVSEEISQGFTQHHFYCSPVLYCAPTGASQWDALRCCWIPTPISVNLNGQYLGVEGSCSPAMLKKGAILATLHYADWCRCTEHAQVPL